MNYVRELSTQENYPYMADEDLCGTVINFNSFQGIQYGSSELPSRCRSFQIAGARFTMI